MTIRPSALWRLMAGLLATLFFVACSMESLGFGSGSGGGGGGGGDDTGEKSSGGFSPTGQPQFSDPGHSYAPPALVLPEAPGVVLDARDDGWRNGGIDMSNVADGYIGAYATGETQAVLSVQNGNARYDYFMSNTGEMEYFPLSMGDGNYSFTLLFQLDGSNYEQFLITQAYVELSDEKLPFTMPNFIVDFDASSEVVKLSYELAEHAVNDVEVVQQVYYWVERNIGYDTTKAREMQTATFYNPDPDEIIQTKKGICYDYAAVVAAMLRANGIPCKLIMGNVAGADGQAIYHAWNMIWLEEEGWVTVEIPTTPGEWERIDLTFAASAGGGADEFVGDGSNYIETSTH